MAYHAPTRKISGRRDNNLPVCPMTDNRSWSHMSTRTTDGTYLKSFAGPFKNTARRKEKKQGVGDDSSVCLLNLQLV